MALNSGYLGHITGWLGVLGYDLSYIPYLRGIGLSGKPLQVTLNKP